MKEKQLTLFGEEDIGEIYRPKSRDGGSGNPVVFNDYDSFIAKFKDIPKTTDDCYTPQDVYDAVVQYVGTVVDLSDKKILRPFFPGGDYEHADYPEDGIVIDNPPFSIFTKCCAFYTAHKIPFFLFGPGLTITSCCKYCTAVFIARDITFENGAKVRCNFGSNLYGDIIVTTAPLLQELISACKSQNKKIGLNKYKYPQEILSFSDMQTICNGGGMFSVKRSECEIIRKIDNHSPKGLFGNHLILCSQKAREKEIAKNAAKQANKKEIIVEFTQREKRIVERLNNAQQ